MSIDLGGRLTFDGLECRLYRYVPQYGQRSRETTSASEGSQYSVLVGAKTMLTVSDLCPSSSIIEDLLRAASFVCVSKACARVVQNVKLGFSSNRYLIS
jgi:hypothetical protein